MKYLLQNVTGITFDRERPFLKGTDILVEDGKIKKIGAADDSAVKKYDMGNAILLPGVVNAHMHFYSTLGRGLSLPGTPAENFVEVLEKFWWKLDRELGEKELYPSVIFPILEGIKGGTVTVFDHHVSTKFIEGSLSAIADILKKYNIKGVLAFEVTNRNNEGIFEKELRENIEFYNEFKDDPMIRGMLGLHANMTLSDKDLENIAKIIPDDMPIHCHIAEDKADQEFVRKLGHKSVTHRLDKFGLLRKNSLLIHGVWSGPSEWELIKDRGCFLVQNPSSNLNNAVGILDLIEANRAGVITGFGTDGMHNLPLKEYQLGYFLTHIKKGLPAVGWMEGAESLSNNALMASRIFGRDVGIVKEGADADLAFFDYEPPTPINEDNGIGHLLFGMINSRVRHTISNGEFLMKDFQLQLDIDRQKLIEDSADTAKELWSRLK